jgi:hypothetical protein
MVAVIRAEITFARAVSHVGTVHRHLGPVRPITYAAMRKEFCCHRNLTLISHGVFCGQSAFLCKQSTEYRVSKEDFPSLSIFLLSWPWFNAIGFREFATETN